MQYHLYALSSLEGRPDSRCSPVAVRLVALCAHASRSGSPAAPRRRVRLCIALLLGIVRLVCNRGEEVLFPYIQYGNLLLGFPIHNATMFGNCIQVYFYAGDRVRALITLLITASLIFSFVTFAVVQPSFAGSQKSNQDQLPENIQSDIRQLKQDIKTTSNDVEILRRDQTNYRIEKDILKEVYSSNYQTINIIITIVLGVIGVLGYLGIRSIKEVKSDYANELSELRKLKSTFEVELLALVNKQKEFESKIGDLAKTNEEQDRRLKVLEIIEKISKIIGTGQWQWALQYISLGLDIDGRKTRINGMTLSGFEGWRIAMSIPCLRNSLR